MRNGKHLEEISSIIKFIELNIKSDLSVGEVSKQGTLSAWEIQRLFRAYTGDTIGNYIRGRRLSLAAQQLLKTPDIRILDLAIEFQFGSQEAFTRAFKNHFKVTPGHVKAGNFKNFSAVKPHLNLQRLEYIANSVSKHPEIRIVDKQLCGFSTLIESTLGSEKEAYETVRQHWQSFFKQIKPPPPYAYGLISGSDPSMNDERLSYVAATELELILERPENFQLYELKEQTYAIFDVKGQQKSCHFVADYLYGIWLPQSEFKRSEGYDFELFKFEVRTGIKEDIVRYHIPIEEK